jgi:hypothetical protein
VTPVSRLGGCGSSRKRKPPSIFKSTPLPKNPRIARFRERLTFSVPGVTKPGSSSPLSFAQQILSRGQRFPPKAQLVSRLWKSRTQVSFSALDVVTSDPARKRFGRPGRKANTDRSRSIANVVGQHDRRWMKGSNLWKSEFSLRNICRDLDRANIEVPKKWLEGRTPSLLWNGVDIRNWEEALDMGFKQLVNRQLRYHLGRMISGHSSRAR